MENAKIEVGDIVGLVLERRCLSVAEAVMHNTPCASDVQPLNEQHIGTSGEPKTSSVVETMFCDKSLQMIESGIASSAFWSQYILPQ
jgi:hypothetical protein